MSVVLLLSLTPCLLPPPPAARPGSRGRVVAMVGDNVNDTAALLAADVAISFNDANAIASDAADVVVAGNGLHAIADAADLARATAAIATTGVVAGMATSVVLMLAAAGGALSPGAAATAQNAVDGLALANACRIFLV